MHTNADVRAQALLGDRLARTKIEQVRRRDLNVCSLLVDLIRLRHHGVECIERKLYHSRVSHPRSVVTVAGFAFLVGPDFGKGLFVQFRIIFDWDLRGHSTHRENISPVTGLDAEERV